MYAKQGKDFKKNAIKAAVVVALIVIPFSLPVAFVYHLWTKKNVKKDVDESKSLS